MPKNQRGFTIIELLVIFIVIGILATIVISSFSGIQQRARDNKRKTDTDTIATFLEKEFQKNGQYPSAAIMTGSVSGVTAVLKGISLNVLAAPGVAAGTNSIVSFTAAPPTSLTGSQYGYWTPNSGACTASYNVTDCATFVLAYKKESDSTFVYTCGRGDNVNNAKAILPGPNGLPSFFASQCSNF